MLLKQSNQKTRICKRCFKEINEATLHNFLKKSPQICHKCLLELGPTLNRFEFEGVKGMNIFWYNETVKEMLYKFKGCKDFELKDAFLDYYSDYIHRKYRSYTLIPAPSSENAIKERGFEQVIEMFSKVKLPMMACIHKTNNIQQHTLKSKERSENTKDMVIDDINLKGKKILIIDDVFTTGSTVKTMISLIKSKNPKKIEILVMAKTIDLDLR